jgi:hypothetical protein
MIIVKPGNPPAPPAPWFRVPTWKCPVCNCEFKLDESDPVEESDDGGTSYAFVSCPPLPNGCSTLLVMDSVGKKASVVP